MKIALAAFGLESSTFTPLQATKDELTIKRSSFVHDAIGKYFNDQKVELIQTMLASGSPHGVLRLDAYREIKEEMLNRIADALPVDGVLLSNHGSMEVEEIGHGELDFIVALRQLVGPNVPISVRLDLHGNIPESFVKQANIVTALRTAPHRDGLETVLRASRLLLSSIRKDLLPVSEMVRVPLLLPGEMVVTDSEPAKSLYARLEEVDRVPGILAASLMVGFAWADTPHTSAAVIVSAEEDRALARNEALQLADRFWELREQFKIDGEHAVLEDALKLCKTSSKSPVFLSDSGDNVTAGGPGDSTLVLHSLRSENISGVSFAQIYDPRCAEMCSQSGEGSVLTLELGGKIAQDSPPYRGSGKVKKLVNGEMGKICVWESAGIEIVITERRVPIVPPALFNELGIDLFKKKICVFKLGYLMPELKDCARRAIIALTPGATTLDITQLAYSKVKRPIFPLDKEMKWRAT